MRLVSQGSPLIWALFSTMGDNGRASKAEQAFLDLVKRYPCMLQPAAFAVAAKLLKGATRGYSQDNLAANAISGAGPVPLRRFSFQVSDQGIRILDSVLYGAWCIVCVM